MSQPHLLSAISQNTREKKLSIDVQRANINKNSRKMRNTIKIVCTIITKKTMVQHENW